MHHDAKKIKILFIVPRLGSITRGVESFAKELISRLDKNKFDITVFSDLPEGQSGNFYAQNCKMVRRESVDIVNKFPRIIRRVLNRLNLGGSADIEAYTLYYFLGNLHKQFAFDIAIPLGGYWTYKLARKFGKKTISIGQSGAVKQWINLSDYFVALTSVDLLKANQEAGEISSKIIPNGVDVSRFRIGQNNSNKKIIICVAALVEDKRHIYLFNALNYVKTDCEVVCIGSGILQQQLMKHAAVKAGKVKFRSLPFEQIPEVYEMADVFTLASLEEAFGIVFIEAMAAGLPIVAHDGGRQRDVIGDAGLFCDTNNAIAYAAALDQALSMPKQETVRRLAIEKYSWNNIVAEYTALFEQIAN